MPARRLRRTLALAGAAAALGTAGCGQTVPGTGVQASAPATGGVDAAAAPAGNHCPSVGTLRAALPRNGGGTYTLSGPVLCSGDWAVTDPLYTSTDPQGDGQPVSVTQLFHRVGDGWQPVDRVPLCAAGTVPAAIHDLTCESN